MDQALQLFLVLTISAVSGGLMQSKPILLDELSMSNGTENELKKLEYSHVNPEPRNTLNCTNFKLHHDYILLGNGSLFLPGLNTVHDYDAFFLQNGTAFLCNEDVDPSTEPTYDFSREFLACPHMLLDPDEFQLLGSGDVHVPLYSKTYGPRDYYMLDKGVYICIPEEFNQTGMKHIVNGTLTHFVDKFPDIFIYVTYVGLLISIVGLLSHLCVFCVTSSVRNLPGCCLASLSLSLLIAYSCFLAAGLASSCSDLGMAIYYFFLTSFFWMNAIAFDVWRSFRVVIRELRISSHRVPWRRFVLYSLYSWTVPAVLTVSIKVLDSSDILPEDFRPSFDTFCWFGQRKALFVFFYVPLIVVMLLNAVFFLDVTYVISRATLKTSRSHEATLKKRFFMFMRLGLIMGLTWVVGLIAGYVDNVVMWYGFLFLNTLQGLFIFVVFSCSSKVRGLFCKGYRKRKSDRGSTSVRTISQISATV